MKEIDGLIEVNITRIQKAISGIQFQIDTEEEGYINWLDKEVKKIRNKRTFFGNKKFKTREAAEDTLKYYQGGVLAGWPYGEFLRYSNRVEELFNYKFRLENILKATNSKVALLNYEGVKVISIYG